MRQRYYVFGSGGRTGVVMGVDAADAMAEARLWDLDEDTGYVRVERDLDPGGGMVGHVYKCNWGDPGPWVAAAWDTRYGIWMVNVVTGETKNISPRAIAAGSYEHCFPREVPVELREDPEAVVIS